MKSVLSALSKFHAQVKPVVRNSNNPFFKSKYASLEDIQRQITGPLRDAGLVVTQACQFNDNGLFVHTKVWHVESSEYMESVFPVVAKNQTAQEYGSAVSYAKRYSLTGLLNLVIADEDDDGNVASAVRPSLQEAKAGKPELDQEKYDAMVKAITEGKAKSVESALVKYTLNDAQKKVLTSMISQAKAEQIKANTK